MLFQQQKDIFTPLNGVKQNADANKPRKNTFIDDFPIF